MITSDFSAYAVKVDAHYRRPIRGKDLRAAVEDLMSKITLGCVNEGAGLIGHIKCIVETPGKGYLVVSITDSNGKPHSRGELLDDIDKMELIINVLLYGLDRKRIQGIVDSLALRELKVDGVKLEVEDLEKHADNHEHKHDRAYEHDHERC
jgi:hypothetical protein